MKIKTIFTVLLCSLALISFQASATGKIVVYETVTLNASADTVWNTVGDFGGLHTWHPAVTSTDLTGGNNDAGSTRLLTLGDGAQITEILVDHNDDTMTYSYVIQKGPLPVKGYYSKIKVMPMGNGKAKLIWSSTFDADGVDDTTAYETISGVYKGGFEALTAKFK